MANYFCPYQYRKAGVRLLLCKGIMKRLGIQETASVVQLAQAYCAHQKFCPVSRRVENTEQARGCYESLSSQEGGE